MAVFFGDDLKNEIIGANDIVEVISEYLPLKRAGRNYLGLCPFHGEKTPSFSVSPERQIYKCFGCGVGGNVVDFVMRIDNLDFSEAMTALAGRAHIEVPKNGSDGKSAVRATEKERMYAINTEAARFFNKKLSESENALEYIEKRRLSQNTVTKFGLGFAPDSWDVLLKHLRVLGFSDEEIHKAGLAGKKETRYYDSFRNRIIFPIIDIKGHVVGFGGRVMDDSKPKYLNSPETPVFDKSRNFYGLNFARADNHKTAVVVEGYMDVISLHQAGITNAIATLGTSFTQEHAKILKRYFDEVVLSYDTDGPGRAATDRCMEIINGVEGLKVRVLCQANGKDPDEYIKAYGKDAFLKLIDDAPSDVEYKVMRLRDGLDFENPEDKIKFVSGAAKIFSGIKNEIEREVYVKKIARETDVSEEAVFSEIYKLSGKTKKFSGGKVRQPAKRASVIQKAEEMLLSLVYGDGELYKSVRNIIKGDFFTDPVNSQVFELLNENTELSSVFDTLTDRQKTVVSDIAVRDFHIDDKRQGAAELIKKIIDEKTKMALDSLKGSDDAEKVKELLFMDKRSKKGE